MEGEGCGSSFAVDFLANESLGRFDVGSCNDSKSECSKTEQHSSGYFDSNHPSQS